ncbi:hypothetical protein [Corynebacterium oculi]|nr:hypothetical protein [Corynebacterium oculi]
MGFAVWASVLDALGVAALGAGGGVLGDGSHDMLDLFLLLVDLLRMLTRTVELGVQQIQLLEEIVQSELITTEQLPSPTDAERKVPKTIKRGYGQTSLTF